MAGARAAERGWSEHGVVYGGGECGVVDLGRMVRAWWWLVVSLWKWGCGFGVVEAACVELWVYGFAS
nr:hypothetical protein CFP56_79371 [Quercus suber]